MPEVFESLRQVWRPHVTCYHLCSASHLGMARYNSSKQELKFEFRNLLRPAIGSYVSFWKGRSSTGPSRTTSCTIQPNTHTMRHTTIVCPGVGSKVFLPWSHLSDSIGLHAARRAPQRNVSDLVLSLILSQNCLQHAVSCLGSREEFQSLMTAHNFICERKSDFDVDIQRNELQTFRRRAKYQRM